ncbi:MAG: T9SS type A sorting domain-containing protein [Bacteroidetes bacterium]|nr:T9SS type A sorting domain-containing protein [Bacteroidota bacterium]MBU1578707.1 T9SS type A sorting domain-containing protein [Bacteroidota bacterium]MBU2556874.1 T9SS type A sorting domain-containing protein [Bacteroidota bacterium]
MKRIYNFSYLLLIPFAILLYANSTGSPGGKSGSPGDGGSTCVECHVGTPTAQSGWISTNIPDAGFEPGETYQISVNPMHSGAGRFGFELTAETAGGSKIGGFTITDAGRTKLITGGNAVTHTFGGNTGGDATTWTVDWTAPVDQAEVRFYAAVNAANGNGNNSGDQIYTTNLFLNQAAPASLVSVDPEMAEKGSSPELTIVGANTNWTVGAPEVSIVNVNNSNEVYGATLVSASSDFELQAVVNIPFSATVGDYHVVVDDLVLPAAFEVTVVSALAELAATALNVYPNPAVSSFVTIETKADSEVTVYNLNGKVIVKKQLPAGSSRLNIDALTAGMYVIESASSEGISNQKLIVR